MDYRTLIAPFLESIRTVRTQDNTVRKYTLILNESIDFFEQNNFDAPNEDFYSALEAFFSQSLAKSTARDRGSLTRRFFTWALLNTQSHSQIPLIEPETYNDSNEKATQTNFSEEHKESIKALPEQTHRELEAESESMPPKLLSPSVEATDSDKQPDTASTENEPLLPPVEALHQQAHSAESTLPPQENNKALRKKTKGKQGRPRKSSEVRSKKISIYLTPTLEADIKDLARIQKLSTPDLIFMLIEHETQRRAEAIKTFRTLSEI